jgi:hypothetical protein
LRDSVNLLNDGVYPLNWRVNRMATATKLLDQIGRETAAVIGLTIQLSRVSSSSSSPPTATPSNCLDPLLDKSSDSCGCWNDAECWAAVMAVRDASSQTDEAMNDWVHSRSLSLSRQLNDDAIIASASSRLSSVRLNLTFCCTASGNWTADTMSPSIYSILAAYALVSADVGSSFLVPNDVDDRPTDIVRSEIGYEYNFLAAELIHYDCLRSLIDTLWAASRQRLIGFAALGLFGDDPTVAVDECSLDGVAANAQERRTIAVTKLRTELVSTRSLAERLLSTGCRRDSSAVEEYRKYYGDVEYPRLALAELSDAVFAALQESAPIYGRDVNASRFAIESWSSVFQSYYDVISRMGQSAVNSLKNEVLKTAWDDCVNRIIAFAVIVLFQVC